MRTIFAQTKMNSFSYCLSGTFELSCVMLLLYNNFCCILELASAFLHLEPKKEQPNTHKANAHTWYPNDSDRK